MTAAALHMHRLAPDGRRVFAFARERGLLKGQDADLGYLVHCLLREAFGALAPKPFAVMDQNQSTAAGNFPAVLGYAEADGDALKNHAASFADPLVHEALGLDRLAAKPMPARFAPGQRLGFRVRVCPVVRSKALRNADPAKPARDRSPEVDALIAAGHRLGIPPDPSGQSGLDKKSVYRDWLVEAVDRHGGARVVAADPVAMRHRRLLRRKDTGERSPLKQLYPDVAFEGVLDVTDAAAFDALLRRGIGRHRAFGFGMLLLRPPPC